MKLTVDRLSNLAVLACAILFAAVLTRQLLQPAGARSIATSGTYQAGDRAPTLDGIDFTAYDTTLLLYVNSGCTYCTASMPFYGQLLEHKTRSAQRTFIVGLSVEDEESLRVYFNAHDVQPDAVISIDTSKDPYKLSKTPTLVAVDGKGIVTRSWVGRLPRALEDEVVGTLGIASARSLDSQ